MADFEAEYRKLNSEQKQAVDTIDGPVLVIAGPGTGKTQLLSMRVANIMRKGEVDAENILCLTFTNKAAHNMRVRLLKLAGPETSKVTVKTFHSFAADIMSTYPDNFWRGARLTAAPDTLQLEIVQEILARLPLDNPLSFRFSGQYTATNDVIRGLKLAKEAGLTPDKLKALIEANLEYIEQIQSSLISILDGSLSAGKLEKIFESVKKLPEQNIDPLIAPLISLKTVLLESLSHAIEEDEGSGKTKNCSKWKSRWLQNQNGKKGMFNERRRNNWWLSFSEVYASYRDEIHSRGYYDYSDMLLEVVTQLEKSPDILSDVQERFQYVLIDEFQDSNSAQLRLAHLVSDHPSAENKPNIMAVGDDDQTIYTFNGAELNNMLYFERNYSEVKTIVLKQNYRSTQKLLDTFELIIGHAEDRLINRLSKLDKQLVASAENSGKSMVVHHIYPTREHQFSGVARAIKDEFESGSGSIGVLARSHESLKAISSIFIQLGTPISYEHQANILDHEAIKQIVLIAEVADAIAKGDETASNHKISKLIMHPMWHFGEEELWALAIDNRKSGSWLSSLINSKSEKQSQLGKWLSWIGSEATYQPLAIMIEYIMGLRASKAITSPFRDYYINRTGPKVDYLQGLSAVRLLQNLVTEFSFDSNSPKLEDFIRFIKIIKENGRGITDETNFVTDEKSVELLSVHKAKGLEFDSVYILDAIDEIWRPRLGGRKPPSNLPLQPPGEVSDDYARLLYVAASRARKNLHISSYSCDAMGNEVQATSLIAQGFEIIRVNANRIETVNVLEENLRWPRLPSDKEEQYLKSRLADYSLSATHLLDYLDLAGGGPEHFFERHILGLPEQKSAAQGFGNAIHSTLQLFQAQINEGKVSAEQLIRWFEKRLVAEQLEDSDQTKFMLYGKELLTNFVSNDSLKIRPGGMAEQKLSGVVVGEAKLSGIIDRIDIDGKNYLITDYKTGKPLMSFETKDRAKEVKAWRHKSQLVFYALMMRNHAAFSAANDIKCQIAYLDAEETKNLYIEYSPSNEEIARMGMLVNRVWKNINDLCRPDTSDYPPDIEGIRQFEEDLLNGNKL